MYSFVISVTQFLPPTLAYSLYSGKCVRIKAGSWAFRGGVLANLLTRQTYRSYHVFSMSGNLCFTLIGEYIFFVRYQKNKPFCCTRIPGSHWMFWPFGNLECGLYASDTTPAIGSGRGYGQEERKPLQSVIKQLPTIQPTDISLTLKDPLLSVNHNNYLLSNQQTSVSLWKIPFFQSITKQLPWPQRCVQ